MVEMDYAQKLKKCNEYVLALEEEQKKIQVFQRELPLCLELVTQAIEACRKELSGTTTSSEQCSEQTISACGGPVFEEFIPMKKSSSCDEDNEEEDGEHESSLEPGNIKKSDWLRSVQLWTPLPDSEERVAKKAKVVEVKPKSGAFQPFQKEKKRDLVSDLQPAVKVVSSAPAPATTTCSTTETAKSVPVKVREEQINIQQTQTQTQNNRKQRRCWSPELHRRFLNALQQLGGSHVATPKQIRDHMKVDGLTNDEVKSHLQKYRLHTRRPATTVTAQSNGNTQQQQIVVVGGIWVPSPPSDEANNGGVYAPVAMVQTPKHSVETSCTSPGVSSSTNTNTTHVS